MTRPALRIVPDETCDLRNTAESIQRFDEIRRDALKRQLQRQRVEMIAWITTFIIVTGLAAVAVAIVAMKEIGL